MAYHVYILYSQSIDKYYIGHTDNLDRRLNEHNTGQTRYSQTGKPWILKYSEEFPDRSTAMKREKEIKMKKSRKYIEYLIGLRS
jgi:putative endonuclease